jgi:hypothetical protein
MVISDTALIAMTGATSVTSANAITVEVIDYVVHAVNFGASAQLMNLTPVTAGEVKFLGIFSTAYPQVTAPGTPDITYKLGAVGNPAIYLGNHHIYSQYMDSLTTKAISAEAVGTGDAMTKHYTHTCAALPVYVPWFSLTDSVETFTPDATTPTTLVGSAGGTGTINYTTGDIVVDFNANVGLGTPITCTYQQKTTYRAYWYNAGGTSASNATVTVIVGRDT